MPDALIRATLLQKVSCGPEAPLTYVCVQRCAANERMLGGGGVDGGKLLRLRPACLCYCWGSISPDEQRATHSHPLRGGPGAAGRVPDGARGAARRAVPHGRGAHHQARLGFCVSYE